MKTNSILFVGCGDLGARSGALLLQRGWEVAGLRRDTARLPPGFVGFAGDYTQPGGLDFAAALKPDFVVATANPSDRSVEGYRRGFTLGAQNLLAGLGGHRPRAILWVSSTRVYAERDGGWVDETSALSVDDPRAVALVAAEQVLLESPHRACAVRFAGIYGHPGGRLLERIRRGEFSPAQPIRYSNRIHRDDCAGFLCHLLERALGGEALAPVYNGVDDLPAAQFEVEMWLAAAMGVQVQPVPPSPGAESSFQEAMHSGHKRCSNRLLHASGYRLLYPDYRSGYGAILADPG
jgi:nucleoside-diphosphate-sugar epimerase